MLNYTITIAISAFFVPHYIGGLFFPFLKSSPGDVIFGIGVVALLCAINVVGVTEAANLNVLLALTDFSTQLLPVLVGGFLVLSPHTLVANIQLGTVPHWKSFLIAIPVGMIAYTGIETISNMAEEAKGEPHTIPKAIKRVVIAVFAIYAALPAVALSALPVSCVAGHCQTLLGVSEAKGGFAGDPVLGIVKHLHLGAFQHAGEIACLTIIPGQADFLGNMYAFGAMLSFTIAHLAVIRLRLSVPDVERPYRGPGTAAGGRAPAAVVRRARRAGHVSGLRHGYGPAHRGGRRGHRLAADRDRRLRHLPPPPGTRSDLDGEDRDRRTGGGHRGRVRRGSGRVPGGRLRAGGDGDGRAAGGP
jgi:amino acid transporter